MTGIPLRWSPVGFKLFSELFFLIQQSQMADIEGLGNSLDRPHRLRDPQGKLASSLTPRGCHGCKGISTGLREPAADSLDPRVLPGLGRGWAGLRRGSLGGGVWGAIPLGAGDQRGNGLQIQQGGQETRGGKAQIILAIADV